MNVANPPRQLEAGKMAPAYHVGSLTYTRSQLIVLFFWLMWNDFSLMLIEQLNSLTGFIYKDHGATYAQMAVIGSVGGFLSMWINPAISTWSDRFRSKFGRRRPFLFFSAPLFAVTLAAIPFMPDLHDYLSGISAFQPFLARLPLDGRVFFIAMAVILCGFFNAMLLSIFSYLYWDVVPENVMGRFQSLSTNCLFIAGLVWNFFILGWADHNIKAVYLGTSAFCLIVYLISTWRIREGSCPPPEPRKSGGWFAPVRTYCVECFSKPYFLWIFGGSLLFQLGNAGGMYQTFYLRYDLGLDLATIGWTQGWAQTVTTIFGLLCGFGIGALVDRWKPVRLLGLVYLAMAAVCVASYFLVVDKWSYLISFSVLSVLRFCMGVVLGAFTIAVFPRDKLGQFCSAQAIFYQICLYAVGPLIGLLFDWLQNNRFGFFWMGMFYGLSGIAYLKVYGNWRKRHRIVPEQ